MSERILYSAKQWNWIAQKYREGYTIETLACFMGISRDTVTRKLQKMGVKPFSQSELDPLDKNEFNELGGL